MPFGFGWWTSAGYRGVLGRTWVRAPTGEVGARAKRLPHQDSNPDK